MGQVIELSQRLQAVSALITDGLTVADVGTDHAYLPIHLLRTGKCTGAIALDINEGPLLRAKKHIEEQGMSTRIETRLSDGVQNLKAGECDCVVLAGMGGALTIRIMEEGTSVFKRLQEFVLQPQSEISKVRRYLVEHDYEIVAEDMVLDGGKFYPMMRVINAVSKEYNKVELRYGKLLLLQKHQTLKCFLEKEQMLKMAVLEKLQKKAGTHVELRKKEIEKELEEIRYALQRYYECD